MHILRNGQYTECKDEYFLYNKICSACGLYESWTPNCKKCGYAEFGKNEYGTPILSLNCTQCNDGFYVIP